MKIIYYPAQDDVTTARGAGEPLLLLVSFDEETAIVAPIDEAVEHHILLERAGKAGLIEGDSRHIDRYFRAVVNEDGADWTFVCPSDYRGITDKVRRISAFYRDGFAALSHALLELGLMVGIDIPRRYRRHMNMLGDESANI